MPGLDGLRGLAVLAVILFHAGIAPGGFLGVDVFFVLSGFLITSLLIAEEGTAGRIGLSRFWAKRARRLLPALLLVLTGVAAYAATIAAPTELSRLRGDGLSALFYYANWHAIATEQGYWEIFSVPSPLAHTWSLAIEEQFYLVWPLCVVALFRWGNGRARQAMLALSVTLACASWLAMASLYVPGVDTSRIYYGSGTRASALLVGVALAARRSLSGDKEGRSLDVFALLAFVFLAVSCVFLDGNASELYLGGFALCQIATAIVLLSAARRAPGPVARALSWTPLRLLGRVSYGLYLWHWPVFVVVTEARVGIGGASLFSARVALSLGLSVASYVAIERPARDGFRGRGAVLVAVAAVLAVLGLLLVSTEPRGGAPTRERVWLPSDSASRPHFSLLVAGDSVAERLAAQLIPIEEKMAVTIAPGGAAGCGLFSSETRLRRRDGRVLRPSRDCAPLASRWASLAHADAALLVLGAPSTGEYEIAGVYREPCDEAFAETFEARAREAMVALASKADQVHVATFPYVVGDEYGERADRQTDCLNTSLRRAAESRPAVRVIDLAAFICPQTNCRTRMYDVLLRHDGQHFEGEGAELVGWWLIERIREARAR